MVNGDKRNAKRYIVVHIVGDRTLFRSLSTYDDEKQRRTDPKKSRVIHPKMIE